MKASSKSALLSPAVKRLLFFILFNGGLGLSQGLCGDVPISEPAWVESDDPGQTVEAEFNIMAWFASSVWRHISAVDGQRCPSEPTCSSYSAQAFRKHGFFIGWVMTVDRLIHEADQGRHSPLVRVNGEFKILDPLEDNDFWWYGGDERDQD